MPMKKEAEKIRKKGAKNAPGDTMLAHITPEEAQILRMMGGSGEVDRETGLPHFAQDEGGGNDAMDREDEKDRVRDGTRDIWGGGTPSEQDQARFAANREAFKQKVARGEVGAPEGPGFLTGERPGRVSANDRNRQPSVPSNMQQEARIRRQETMATGTAPIGAEDEAARAAAIKANPVGYTGMEAFKALASPVKGMFGIAGQVYQQESAVAAARKKVEDKYNVEFLPGERPVLEHESAGMGADERRKQQIIQQQQASTNKPVVPTNTEQQATEDLDTMGLDPFTRGARRKKGYQSTIAAGGSGGSSLTMGKTLLGS